MSLPLAVRPSGRVLSLATVAGAYAVWRTIVLGPAAKRLRHWGPRWLATLLSGTLYHFAKWWMKYSDNCEEVARKGTFAPNKQYVIVWHPHGAFTIASLYFMSHFWARNYPGEGNRYVCVAPFLLKIPILGEFLLMCHARSQDARTFDGLLKSGASVAVQPGGLVEQVNTDDKQEKVFFPAKLGFIRIALKHGVPLLPIYAFGENQLYPTKPWTIRLNQWFYRKLKSGSLVVLGLGGIPNSPILPNPLMLPSSAANGLHIRFGEPVDIGPREENPSDERVRQAFDLYVAALQKLFDQYKDELLPKEVAARGLKVIYRADEKTEVIPKSSSRSRL